MEEGFEDELKKDRRCTYKIDLWNKAPDEPRKLLFKVDEEWVDISPYGDDVWFIQQTINIEDFAGQVPVDRNNIQNKKMPVDQPIELIDGYNITIINMLETEIEFKVSGELEPPPEPEPEPVDIVDDTIDNDN